MKNIFCLSFLVFIIGICGLVSCATTEKQSNSTHSPQPGSKEIAAKYAIYAMMASESYHAEEKIKFPLELAGWSRVDLNGNKTDDPAADHWFTGLSYDIFQKDNSNDVVIAFRGTDSKWDYIVSNFTPFISPAYKQAKKEVLEYKNLHPNRNLIVVGHSLGGGLALSVSVWNGVNAYTFDSSPRIFDGLGDHKEPAERVLIFQKGEILERFRQKLPKVSEVVPDKNTFEFAFNFNGVSNHRGDCLAYGLLSLGAENDPVLQNVLDKTKQSNPVKCM